MCNTSKTPHFIQIQYLHYRFIAAYQTSELLGKFFRYILTILRSHQFPKDDNLHLSSIHSVQTSDLYNWSYSAAAVHTRPLIKSWAPQGGHRCSEMVKKTVGPSMCTAITRVMQLAKYKIDCCTLIFFLK